MLSTTDTSPAKFVELPARADNIKELLLYFRQMVATNQTRGLLTQLVGGYYRYLSAEKLYPIKRDPFLHHMKSGNCDFMSQYTVGNHGGRITFSPVGMFVPEFFQLGVISDCYISGLCKRKLQVMVPLIPGRNRQNSLIRQKWALL